jgi:glucose-1-phosphatase
LIIPAHIKNIIFDLGGVILNIDYNLTKQAFEKLGLKEFEKFYSQATQKKIFDDFETGRISAEAFRMELRRITSLVISDECIDDAWNAMLLDLPLDRVELLQHLKTKYRLFLLSNTNEIHIQTFSKYLETGFGFKNMSHLFEKEYLSYKVGLRKPDEKIFELVILENKLRREETLFIDDSIQHVEGAGKAGLNALLLEKGKTIMELFR